jgi:hypothetical protein
MIFSNTAINFDLKGNFLLNFEGITAAFTGEVEEGQKSQSA